MTAATQSIPYIPAAFVASTASAASAAPSSPDPTAALSASATLTRRVRAFDMHCNGYHSPAIAEELEVPERTIRSWIAATLDDLAADRRDHQRHALELALQRQEQVLSAAWESYERAIGIEVEQFALVARSTREELAANPPRFTSASARYLQIILTANREISRLQGLYHHAAASVPPLSPSEAALPATPTPAAHAPLPTPIPVPLPSLRRQRPEDAVPFPAESATAPSASTQFPAESATTLTASPASLPPEAPSGWECGVCTGPQPSSRSVLLPFITSSVRQGVV